MTIAVGAPLSEVFGPDTIKIKKKDKKKKDKQQHMIDKHIYPQEIKETINVFDDNFQGESNIMPYGTIVQDNYQSIQDKNNSSHHYGNYFPYDQYTLNGNRIQEPSPPPPPQQQPPQPPPPPQQQPPQPPPPPQQQPPQPPPQQQPPQPPPPQQPPQPPPQQQPPSDVYNISRKEYIDFKKFQGQQHTQFINNQKEKSQLIESFSNINDDFNDVLLFGLMGIFFLIFTDYIYKLGKKSY